MCDYSTVFFWYPVSHFLSRSLSLPACDLSIIYHECVLPPDRICSILSSFTFFPLFALSSFSSESSVPRPFIQITMVFFFFFSFQLESTNNVWSSHHQGCCQRVAMATSSPRSNGHCGENGEAEMENTHTDKHTRTNSYPPHHTGSPCSFALTASGSVKVIIDLPSQSQRS